MTERADGASPQAVERPEFERYRIEGEVGAGGMSVVYAARDVELDREVALKVMRRDVGESQDQQRLREEARALAGLNHANIVPVYDVGYAKDGRLYMSMELVRGKSLREWIDARPRSVAEVLDVLIAAGRGLAAAHAVSLVHCDFKPSNVLVGEDGRVRVVDFGIPQAELDMTIDSGIAFRTSGCPGKFADDISACDRPYGDSPPSDIASYPFQPENVDIRKIRSQMGMLRDGETYEEGEDIEMVNV